MVVRSIKWVKDKYYLYYGEPSEELTTQVVKVVSLWRGDNVPQTSWAFYFVAGLFDVLGVISIAGYDNAFLVRIRLPAGSMSTLCDKNDER